jgi:hypothetical protein
MLWLCLMLGDLGFVDMQKTMLQHILLEAQEQRFHLLFIIAACNYAGLEHAYRPAHHSDIISHKFASKMSLGDFDTPVWDRVLTLACQKANMLRFDPMYGSVSASYIRPLSMLVKAFNYSLHGVDCHFPASVRVGLALHKNELRNPALRQYLLLAAMKVPTLVICRKSRAARGKDSSHSDCSCLLKSSKRPPTTIGSACSASATDWPSLDTI